MVQNGWLEANLFVLLLGQLGGRTNHFKFPENPKFIV